MNQIFCITLRKFGNERVDKRGRYYVTHLLHNFNLKI